MKDLLHTLDDHGFKIVAHCCGHGRYPATVIVKLEDGRYMELYTGTIIPRTRRYYLTDADGFYYIPELVRPVPDN